jgi:hypothetical protein
MNGTCKAQQIKLGEYVHTWSHRGEQCSRLLAIRRLDGFELIPSSNRHRRGPHRSERVSPRGPRPPRPRRALRQSRDRQRLSSDVVRTNSPLLETYCSTTVATVDFSAGFRICPLSPFFFANHFSQSLSFPFSFGKVRICPSRRLLRLLFSPTKYPSLHFLLTFAMAHGSVSGTTDAAASSGHV